MRLFLLAILVIATIGCDDKKKSIGEPQDPGKENPQKPKPDGAPDLFAAKNAHHRGWITEVRVARGARFALAHVQIKKGDPLRSVLLEKTAQGAIVERVPADEHGEILGFDVSEEELCLLRSSEVDARDPVTNKKYVDLRIQCEGVAGGQPLVFHAPDLATDVKVFDKYGVPSAYRPPLAGKTVFHPRDLQRPFAQLKLVGREKILLVSGDFGERLYKIDKDGNMAWEKKGREVRPRTEIFSDNGVPLAAPRLAVGGGRLLVLGGFIADEHPIFVEHYKNERLIPPATGHREGLLVSAWDLDGKIQWQRAVGGTESLHPTAVGIGAEGINLLALQTDKRRASFIARLGLDGAQKWTRDLAGKNLVTRMHALAERGEIIAAGACRGREGDDGTVTAGGQGCVFRFNANDGTLNSTREFGAAQDDAIFAVDLLENGKLLIGGYADGPTGRGNEAAKDRTQAYAWGTW